MSNDERRTYMYRVPKHLRLMHPESYLPKNFHFGPYAPDFFPPPLHDYNVEHDDGGGRRVKEIIVEDLLGRECFAALVENVKNQLDGIKTTYIQISPATMDAIPDEKLATLFASSAAVIVASSIMDNPPLYFIPIHIASNMQLPNCNYYLALVNASAFVENQIPISLLTLACDAFYDRGYRFDDQRLPVELTGLRTLFNVDFNVYDRSFSSKLMLLFLLRSCTRFGHYICRSRPFNYLINAEWVERNYSSDKSIMAFIYDFIVGSVDAATATAAVNQIQNRPPTSLEATRNNFLFRMTAADKDESFAAPPPASRLRSYGVKFRKSTDGGFKAIRFEKETNELTLPVIQMFDDTLDLFRNLVVYEMTSVAGVYDRQRTLCAGIVSSTIMFFDFLIDSAEDVEVLIEAGVLRIFMERNNSTVAAMWDGLVTSMPIYVTQEHEQILASLRIQGKGWWRRAKGSLKEKYKQRPWLILSAVAAFLLLSLTIVQTAFSIASYYKGQ